MPLGPAVSNAHIYVVDDKLAPVPLAPPGRLFLLESVSAAAMSMSPSEPELQFGLTTQSECLYRSGILPLAPTAAGVSRQMDRSRSMVSASRSVTSRTPIRARCACVAVVIAPSRRIKRAWWRSTPASGHSRPASCKNSWSRRRRAATFLTFHWQESLAADCQWQD